MKDLKDNFGNKISVGDIVIRPAYSSFAFHKVLGITKNSIILSRIKKTRGDLKYSRESFTWFETAFTLEDVEKTSNTEGKLYVSKFYSNFVKLLSEEQWSIKR